MSLDFPDAPTVGDIYEPGGGPVFEWIGDAWDRVTGPAKIPAMAHTVGDVKSSFLTVDHEGWILLDGRLVSTLTSTQQNRASSLGFAANLPDANGSVAMQDGGAPGAISGSMGKTIAVANLPAHNMTAASAGAHTHPVPAAGLATGSDGDHAHPGPRSVYGSVAATTESAWDRNEPDEYRGAHTHPITGTATASSAGAHTHTVALGGGGQALDVTPRRMSVNLFCFLGA